MDFVIWDDNGNLSPIKIYISGMLEQKTKSGKFIRVNTFINNRGYTCVKLAQTRARPYKVLALHRIMAIGFLGHSIENPDSMTIDHIDGNKLNNKVNNLELITKEKNASRNNKKITAKYIAFKSFVTDETFRLSNYEFGVNCRSKEERNPNSLFSYGAYTMIVADWAIAVNMSIEAVSDVVYDDNGAESERWIAHHLFTHIFSRLMVE